MIPPILSQTWKTSELPIAAANLQAGWKLLNPEFDIRLYDDMDARSVIEDVFPQFIDQYDALPLPILRADIFRYAVLYRDGGVYADIDMECLKPIGPLLYNRSCLLSVEAHLFEPRMRALGYPAPLQVANCILACEPKHPFMAALVERCFELIVRQETITSYDVEALTGPRMLSALYFSRHWDAVTLLNQIYLMAPLNFPNIWPINRNMYARHLTFGTWKDWSAKRSLKDMLFEMDRPPWPFPSAPVIDPSQFSGRSDDLHHRAGVP